MVHMDATTIVLPSAPADARRPPLPLLAAVVPVVAGIVLWLITGSLFALCFAALGPLMLIASYADGLRARRRERRRVASEADAAWQRAEAELERLHAEEHAALWSAEPDAAGCLSVAPLRGHVPPNPQTTVVVGRGARVSRVQARGGEDDRSRAFRTRAHRLEDAPVAVPLGAGICIRAPRPVAEAVARALVTQLCLRFPAAQLGLRGEGVAAWGLQTFPHAHRHRTAFRLALGEGAEGADAVICLRMPDEATPDGVTTVLECSIPSSGRLRSADGTREVAVEALSVQQAAMVGTELAGRADAEEHLPDRIAFQELTAAGGPGLPAVIGRGERAEVQLDLIEDGPHAIVTGMTGTGKSELMVTWIAAMATVRSPEEVAFVLVDFKGGTAFDPLRRLPHVAAVVTDLDAQGARRGVGSLTAELRRREAALAAAGARDVSECPDLARLVIVVDEFAALVQEHPDLAGVFTDVAARGRALGMHLILGTQRAGGIVRDALAANCPLRISLRVADAADSRSVIGSDAAAELPGGPESRGLAFVRRPRDGDAHLTRVARTAEADLIALQERWSGRPRPTSPWLPPLPRQLPLPAEGAAYTDGAVVLGRADEPDEQAQPWVTLPAGHGLGIIGGPGSGKSTAIAMLLEQAPDAVRIPVDAEDAWDAVAELAGGRHGRVLCDDLDVLLGQYPPDHAQVFLARWEVILRDPAGAVITASRMSGPLARLFDALPHRALLRMTSKVEHIAAGGDAAAFDRGRVPGRAWLDGSELQFCIPSPASASTETPVSTAHLRRWLPEETEVGVVTTAVRATVAVLAAAHPRRQVIAIGEAAGAIADSAAQGEAAAIIVGDPEEWRAQWSLLQRVRTTGALVFAAECASELRQLGGVRELPPYARLHADRAWVIEAGSRPRRVLLG